MFETMPRCCVECFAHEWLRDCVRENSVERGDCDYCERKDVELLSIGVLYGPFERLLDLYVPSNGPHGNALIDLVQSATIAGRCLMFGWMTSDRSWSHPDIRPPSSGDAG
jgi:hypothetical protein